ncbi:MAG: hypothetical protein IPM17_00440 [Verrucomicrobia bacterium]|nr:hypothetical protein [Verrucomicrobiota bacterium]
MKADWIRPLRTEDLVRVCAIHEAAFPGFFLTFLGSAFLAEFYGAFLREEQGIALVAVEQGGHRVIGAVAGPLVPRGFLAGW